MKSLFLFLTGLLVSGLCYGQLASKFPGEVAGYKPVGKPDCQSMNMPGQGPMNSCSQTYSNGKLTLSVEMTEYPKGNPVLANGGFSATDEGHETAAQVREEKITINGLPGHVTYVPKTRFADISLHKADRLTISVSGQGQPNWDAVKALAQAIK